MVSVRARVKVRVSARTCIRNRAIVSARVRTILNVINISRSLVSLAGG